jgi:glucan 1,3-beta-glucosidase
VPETVLLVAYPTLVIDCADSRLPDDTLAVQNFLNSAAASGKIAYFDHGAYVISNTISVPVNVHITGELLAIIMATGTNFGDQNNPKPMWQVGQPGQSGTVEMSDLVFEAKGPVPGAVIVEWNIACTGPGTCGMWDVHWRIGGSAGTELQQDTCLNNPIHTTTLADTVPCQGAFLLLHVTSQANIYMENTWGWVADHELDLGTRDQIDIYNGR